MEFKLGGSYWLNDEEVVRRVKTASVQPLAKCAALVEAEAKRSLSKGQKAPPERDSFGRFRAAAPQSSPPGEPPYLKSGNLRASIQSAPTEKNTQVVGPTTTAWYGRVHEFGCLINVTPKMRGFLKYKFGWNVRKGTIYIPPRPFMRPALDRCIKQFPEQFRNLNLGTDIPGGPK